MKPTSKFISLLFACLLTFSACFTPARAQECIQVYDTDRVDSPPCFPGGDRAMLKFINSTCRYPAEAISQGIQGRVMCSFVVKPDGSLSCINVVRGVHGTLDREALRIISEMPKWEAGRIKGEPVPVYYVLSIPFKIYDSH